MKYKKIVHIKQDLLSFSSLPLGIWEYFKDIFNLDFNFSEAHYIDGDVYLLEEELNFLYDYLRENYNKVREILKVMEENNSSFVNFCRQSENSHDLIQTIKDFLELYKKQASIAIAMIGAEFIIKEKLMKELEKYIDKNRNKQKFEETILILSICLKESYTIKEKKDLIKLASIDNNEGHIKNHLEKYSWLKTKFFRHTPYTEEDIKNRLKEIEDPTIELKRLEENYRKNKQEFINIINELNPNSEFTDLINDFQNITFLRTARVESINLGTFYISELLREALKEDFEDFPHMLHEEFIKFLKTKEKPDNLPLRKQAYALIARDGNIKIYFGDDIGNLKREFNEEAITGIIASRGIAQGTVKLLKDESEIWKIKKGDILVTEMTTPDFLMAMEKSAAIVTDIGGLTSHSSIVSRELGIPCIVGTENATKVLKDGDYVLVDAQEKGEVIKLKRSKYAAP